MRTFVRVWPLALILSVGLFAIPATDAREKKSKQEQEQTEQKKTVSKAVAKPFKAAQDAMNEQKYPEALAKLKEIESIPGKTAYDEYLLSEMYGFVYARTNQYPEAAKALEAGLNSGFLEQADVAQRVKALAQVNYQIKNYDKAIEYGKRAVEGGFADDNLHTLISQAYYLKEDYAGTKSFVGKYVDDQIAKGQKPTEQSLQLVMSSCVKLNDGECVTQMLERLVTYYPKQEWWQHLLSPMLRPGGSAEKSALHVYRLASEVDILSEPVDYTEMAQLAMERGSPGEAQQALEKGLAKGVFTEAKDKDLNKRLLESAKRQAALDQASLPKIEQDSSTAKTGDKDVGLGLAYYSYQQYPKAVEAFKRGLAKGGLRNEPEAQILLAIAQYKSGNKEEAGKTFELVKGNPTLERLAKLWRIYINSPAVTPAIQAPASRLDTQQPSRLDS